MRFSVRNTFYLKISKYDVLPLYLYLDERHVDWMSERTLLYVISDLRPLVGPKLDMERNMLYGSGSGSSTKKGTVDVHRGETYQFAYFLRKSVPHAVVMKTRNYVMVNNPQKTNPKVAETGAKKSGSASKAKAKRVQTTKTRAGSSRKGRGKAVEVVSDSEPQAIELSDSDEDGIDVDLIEPEATRRRSARINKSRPIYREGGDEQDEDEAEDVEVKEEEAEPALDLTGEAEDDPMQIETLMGEEEEETKLKPKIQLSFRSLEMRDLCLCVVVEPWPAGSTTSTGAQSRATTVHRALPQSTLSPPAPTAQSPNVGRERAETPLFLPDYDRGRSQTPAAASVPMRFSSVFSSLESLDVEDDVVGDEHGMMAFSQALNKVSGDRMGVAGEDEDEMDGGALYGDADEMHDFLL